MKNVKLLKTMKKPSADMLERYSCARLVVTAWMSLGLFLVPVHAIQAAGLSLGGTIDAPIEEIVEDKVEDSIEDAIVDRIDDLIDDESLSLGGYIDNKVEESIEESVEESLEETIDESITDAVDETIEEQVEETVVDTIENDIENDLEDSIESIIEDSVEQTVANTVEDTIEESVAEAIEISVEQQVVSATEEGVQGSVETQVAGEVEERLESTIDNVLQRVESRIEVDERRIHKDQWLVMAEPAVFEKLAEEGYLFAKVTELPGIGMRLAQVAAPSSFDISEIRQGVMDVLGSDHAEVDLNHIYTAGAPVPATGDAGIAPRTALSFPADTDAMVLRIGMIDSQVDVSHTALANANIQSRDFVSSKGSIPNFHGTAIASIIAADTAGYRGLAPRSELYAAAVFENDKERGEIASTVSLVMALDWLLSSGVEVINISLAGPPNRLLQAALNRAAEKDVMILAAAGNGGPVAQPMYPAAYDTVVAVTAVDSSGKVFRLANRGAYLDIAAPGVNVRHAKAGGGYAVSSGTSFAVPFAATAAARLKHTQPGQDAMAVLYSSAEDLGAPGRDEIYGYGLLRPEQVLITSGI